MVRVNGNLFVQSRHAVAFGEDRLAVVDHGNRGTGNMVSLQLPGYQLVKENCQGLGRYVWMLSPGNLIRGLQSVYLPGDGN